MSAHIEWGSARYTYIHGTATPGEIEHGDDANSTAAMQITYGSDGDALVIEGRPEDLVALFRGALDTAQAILMETVRSPELRRMYGEMAEAEHGPSQGGTDPVPGVSPESRAWHHDGTRCVRANTTHDCPERGGHRYGATFGEAF